MLHIASKVDATDRDERSRARGRAGEEPGLAHKHGTLKATGRDGRPGERVGPVGAGQERQGRDDDSAQVIGDQRQPGNSKLSMPN